MQSAQLLGRSWGVLGVHTFMESIEAAVKPELERSASVGPEPRVLYAPLHAATDGDKEALPPRYDRKTEEDPRNGVHVKRPPITRIRRGVIQNK